MSNLQPQTGTGTLPARRGYKSAFIGALVGWIFDYYEVALMTFLIVPIAAAFGLSGGQTALVFSIQLLAMAVGGIGFGMLADKYGRKKIFCSGPSSSIA